MENNKEKFSITRTQWWFYSINSEDKNETKNLDFKNIFEEIVRNTFNESINELESSWNNYSSNEIVALMKIKLDFDNEIWLDNFNEEADNEIDSEDSSLEEEYKRKLFQILNEIENWTFWKDIDFYKFTLWWLINRILTCWDKEKMKKWVDMLYEDICEFVESWYEDYLQYVNTKIDFLD